MADRLTGSHLDKLKNTAVQTGGIFEPRQRATAVVLPATVEGRQIHAFTRAVRSVLVQRPDLLVTIRNDLTQSAGRIPDIHDLVITTLEGTITDLGSRRVVEVEPADHREIYPDDTRIAKIRILADEVADLRAEREPPILPVILFPITKRINKYDERYRLAHILNMGFYTSLGPSEGQPRRGIHADQIPVHPVFIMNREIFDQVLTFPATSIDRATWRSDRINLRIV